MTKTELAAAVAEQAQLTKVDAKKAVDAVFEIIKNALSNEEPVSLIGFGTFSITERSERKGVNPATKQTIVIPARKSVRFKAGAALNEKIK
ncbi:MAG: HU family DNA-binding protein [Candidatus Aphodosoma sp.]